MLEYRIGQANEGAPAEDQVDLAEVIEWHLIAPITIREVPLLEEAAPGTAAALTEWLDSSIYSPKK